MKVWHAYSSEHSARVKIIGTFETPENAESAANLFNRLLDINDMRQETDSPTLPSEITEACRRNNLADFTQADVRQLKSFETIFPAGTEIRVEVGDTEIQALLKVLIHFGARIEILGRSSCLK